MGQDDAIAGRRHRANWELRFLRVANWVPFVDVESIIDGYGQGYANGMARKTWQGRLPGEE